MIFDRRLKISKGISDGHFTVAGNKLTWGTVFAARATTALCLRVRTLPGASGGDD